MNIHFFNVGLGSMTLICFPNGKTYLYDCNITDDNKKKVMRYLDKAMGSRETIEVFICSHRDADHMRGIRTIHSVYPIGSIRDAGVPGTTTDSSEYRAYMRLRQEVGHKEIKARTYLEVGNVVIRFMNSKDENLSGANDQSIVMKIEYKGRSCMLAGDTSFRPWRETILPNYSATKLRSNILLASHHGSLSFFDDPADEQGYYTAHIRKIKPAMTLISVGPNAHGLPDAKAVKLYKKYSSGSNKGNKVYRTDEKGNMKLTLKSSGGWNLKTDQ